METFEAATILLINLYMIVFVELCYPWIIFLIISYGQLPPNYSMSDFEKKDSDCRSGLEEILIALVISNRSSKTSWYVYDIC